MGADVSCQRDTGCCRKDMSSSNEIVRARPVDSPGLMMSNKAKSEESVQVPVAANDASGDAHDNADWQNSGADKATILSTTPPPPEKGLSNHQETYEDGSTYEGQSLEGNRHGKGVWRSAYESYEGEWENDCRHGQGRQTWEDGRLYDGQFAKGKFHGQGRMEWYTPQGVMIFEGQYENDLKQGKGKYVWPDGRIYDGEWGNGKRWGEAIYTNKSGEKRRGIWNDDKLERWCTSRGEGEEDNP